MGLLEAIRKAAAARALRELGNTRIPEPRRELTPKEQAELEEWERRIAQQKYAHK